MVSRIEFKHRSAFDPRTRQEREEVVVLREGNVVATVPEGHPLRRMLNLSEQEAAWMLNNYPEVMRLQPEVKKILEAVIEYRKEETAVS